MVKSGLSADIIIAKIKASKSQFDTSTPALVKLSEAKVPDAIVVAMVEKEQRTQEQSSATQKVSNEVKDSVPEQGTLSDLVGKKKVYILTDFIKARDLIAKELKGTFELADKIEDSDFVVFYKEQEEELGASAGVYGNTATVRKLSQMVGTLNVAMPAKDGNPNRIRHIYSSTKSKYYIWEDQPAKSTTKQFLKDLNKLTK